MKAHKMYPLPLHQGHQREALIELGFKELLGLYALIGEVLDDADKEKTILLNFENTVTTNLPLISCIYDKVQNDS